DPLLAPSLISHPGLRVPGAFDAFELGVRALIGQQVRLNRQAIQADATASPEGRGPGWAEAILHDPPIKKKAPSGRFFCFCGI
ncbi:hypothetical protein WKH72_22885, partial [Pantoea agglomerans]